VHIARVRWDAGALRGWVPRHPRRGGVIMKTRRHEALIKEYGEWARQRGFRPSTAEHPKDLLLCQNGVEWLVEGKILYRGNASVAVRGAIGQLFEYGRFFYGDAAEQPTLVALFGEAIGDAYVGLLEDLGIRTVWRQGRQWIGSAAALDEGLADAAD
jgi:hypothetical protein